jgi:hypothetical protein
VACRDLSERHSEAIEEATARRLGCERSAEQIEGILGEVLVRSTAVGSRLDAHYASAEEELLEGLAVPGADEFRRRAEQALRPREVKDILNEALEDSAQLLVEKFEEFRADVRLAARLSIGTGAYGALHADVQAEQDKIRAAMGRAKKRKWFRLGAHAVGLIAVGWATATSPGGAVVAHAAVQKGIDTFLPDVDVPTENVAERVRRVRELIGQSRSRAERAFEEALREQVVDQARRQLVAPLQTQAADFGQLESRLAATQVLIDAYAERAIERERDSEPRQEGSTTGDTGTD